MAKTYYTIRKQSDTMYHLAKVTADFDVEDVYNIVVNPQTGEHTCTCPSKLQPCKHVHGLKFAQRLNPDDYQNKYWEIAPKAAWITAHDKEDL